MVVYNIGIYEFTKEYKFKYSLLLPLKIIWSFYPYQIILGLSAFRAVYRIFIGEGNWEKTLHINAHRDYVSTLSNEYVRTS
jgi:glycosyltransferase XagB